MYGKELSYGMMDLLAQYWDISNNTSHTLITNYLSMIIRMRMRYRNSMLFGKDFILLYLNVILIISSIEKNRSSIKYWN